MANSEKSKAKSSGNWAVKRAKNTSKRTAASALTQRKSVQNVEKASYDALKVRKVGGSLGVTMPKAMLQELGVEEGDLLYTVRTKDGLKVSPYDPEFEQQMKAARRIMKKRRNALRELAK